MGSSSFFIIPLIEQHAEIKSRMNIIGNNYGWGGGGGGGEGRYMFMYMYVSNGCACKPAQPTCMCKCTGVEEGGRIFQVKACDSPKLDVANHTCVH